MAIFAMGPAIPHMVYRQRVSHAGVGRHGMFAGTYIRSYREVTKRFKGTPINQDQVGFSRSPAINWIAGLTLILALFF